MNLSEPHTSELNSRFFIFFGVSMSEPHTNELNSGFLIIIGVYVGGGVQVSVQEYHAHGSCVTLRRASASPCHSQLMTDR